MDCFYVADMTATDDTKEEAQTFVNGLTVKSSYAAVYFPWLKMVDPDGRLARSDRRAAVADSSPGCTRASTPAAACGRRRPAPRRTSAARSA